MKVSGKYLGDFLAFYGYIMQEGLEKFYRTGRMDSLIIPCESYQLTDSLL